MGASFRARDIIDWGCGVPRKSEIRQWCKKSPNFLELVLYYLPSTRLRAAGRMLARRVLARQVHGARIAEECGVHLTASQVVGMRTRTPLLKRWPWNRVASTFSEVANALNLSPEGK